ncbi:hypothetical protein NDU88_005093 [Pleurodeles waltl]|uniref:UPAR/Ly6 domain-containing protein n=1 Tax=Pleurodeles waltl TaxID=8319 RepID=A0AAV7V6A4_PLEWA|nr:hypothetical protein NDU88_005093 [Pleurodeles waltl]
MRCALGSLLAAALLVGLARALTCHNCVSTTQADCNTPSVCSAGQTYCFKFVGLTDIAGSLTLKGCNSTCREGPVNANGISGIFSCCTTNRCNGDANGAPGVRISYAALYAAVGVTALLLGVHP